MSYLEANAAFFCEIFWPTNPTTLDTELDEAVSEHALERGTMQGFCNVAGQATTFAVSDPNLRENVFADVSGTGRSASPDGMWALSRALCSSIGKTANDRRCYQYSPQPCFAHRNDNYYGRLCDCKEAIIGESRSN